MSKAKECETCKNLKIPYDENKARHMTVEEVRKIYPRLVHECEDCGQTLVKYASFDHYLRGDW